MTPPSASSPSPAAPEAKPRVALLVTCLADLFRPTAAFAAVRLLEQAGCTVTVPRGQTCCGQPAYNSGDRKAALRQAKHMIDVFEAEAVDHLVAPSGSCAAMVRLHYPALLADDRAWAPRARTLAERTHELTSFLVDVLGWDAITARFDGTVTYHDTCSGLRELGIHAQPRHLLSKVQGLTLTELAHPAECCGFGGTFSVKMPAISERMVEDKARDVRATGAHTLVGGDVSCLLNIAGRLRRQDPDRPIAVRHVAEILAGLTDNTPPLGVDDAPAPAAGRP